VWTLDFRPDFTAAESGLDAFVAFDKEAEFIGKRAAREERAAGPKKKLVTLVVETKDVDCIADEPIFHEGKCVGYVTSGGYGHWVKKSLALGYVPTALAKDGTRLQVELLGDFYDATVTAKPLYDPSGRRMRS
jgi:dimethylglycine dehydrogenase